MAKVAFFPDDKIRPQKTPQMLIQRFLVIQLGCLFSQLFETLIPFHVYR